MKVSLRWLADYIDLPERNPEELARVLGTLGHEVESIQSLPVEFTGVVTALVDEVKPHPNADKVRLCTVAYGDGPVAVVCGAWNFEIGATVAFAPPGSVLAGEFEIGRRIIRGVESNGMICSERELGLGDEHGGILVLDKGTPVGVEFATLVERPDTVLELAITPNRADCMSMVGIARELSAYYQVPFRVPEVTTVTAAGSGRVSIVIDDPAGCYRFVGREVTGTRVTRAPFQMRQRLRTAGMRPINHVVDVTNYVMLELGQPLHAFDLDRVAGERIVVRRAKPGETLRTLDGVNRALSGSDLVVADAEVASALAGTMGGEHSEVSTTTTRVLVEAATWDPPTILHMSARHGLRSEASARFERGVDPSLPPVAAARAAALIARVGGGACLAGGQDVITRPVNPWTVKLSVAEVGRTLGDGLDAEAVSGYLRRFHLQVVGEDPLLVTVPTYRLDLTRPIDLVEEVARLKGLDSFNDSVPRGPGGGWSVSQRRLVDLRRVLLGAGLSQAVNLSFIGPGDLEAMRYPLEHGHRRTIAVRNPLREEEGLLRTSLLPGLLRSARRNVTHGIADVALFEIGKVFFTTPSDADRRVPHQPDLLSWVVTGEFGDRSLDGGGRPVDYFTAAAIWRLLSDQMRLDLVELRPVEAPFMHPGRTAEVWVNGEPAGLVGELHPAVARTFDLAGRIAVAELELDRLIGPLDLWQFQAPSLYPPAIFDLAFDVEDGVPAATLVGTTAAAAGLDLEEVGVFDEYRGAALGVGRKSLAVRYQLRAADRTLSTEEVSEVRAAIIAAAAASGWRLRG